MKRVRCFIQWEGNHSKQKLHTRSWGTVTTVLSSFSVSSNIYTIVLTASRIDAIPLIAKAIIRPECALDNADLPSCNCVLHTQPVLFSTSSSNPSLLSTLDSTNRCRPGAYIFGVGDYKLEDDDHIRRRWQSRSYGVCRTVTYEACVPTVMAFCGVVIVTDSATFQSFRHYPRKNLQHGANRKYL